VQILDDKLESLIRDLPDEKGARLFFERLSKEHPRAFQSMVREPGLLSDALALAAWSPLLAATLEQNPEYVPWLMRERRNSRVRTRDELKESLARFALTNSSVDPQVLLARFRRRELLRKYLHDIRGTHTLVETTEELSNLADAVLEYAFGLARQDLDNRYGSPLRPDERGRIATAEFCVIGLGKLGSYELNYASDIDLVFIYSDEGSTSGSGARGEVSNREYFIKLAETVAKLVGQPAGEGAAYRVDLRLRPHGRDGALACSLNEAVRYYRETAQSWELQALIRARASAGSAALFSRFASATREQVFRPDISVSEALASVRLAKQKIDKHIERDTSGFNVKLNRGGIREIEFIAQALQLAHGGRDEWLRVPHTLISLGRLADRNLLADQERTELSAAYLFLRTLEHRLQMEHGLQTHTVPQARQQRTLVAKRMNFSGATALEDFDSALKLHTTNVRKTFARVFAEAEGRKQIEGRTIGDHKLTEEWQISAPQPAAADTASTSAAAGVFLPYLVPRESGSRSLNIEGLAELLHKAARESVNPHRAITFMARVAASLDKSDAQIELLEDNLVALVHLCGSSEFFAEMVASSPSLLTSLKTEAGKPLRRDYRTLLRSTVDGESSFSAELSALRREWSKLLVEIGIRDAAGEISMNESNRLQMELAVASINAAYLVARRELVRRYGRLQGVPRIAIFGLGRLGSGGFDYGSDLDIIIVYDSLVSSPVASLSPDEAYARLGELMISALSSVTREGYLYRVDLRLRPDGKNGPLVASSQGFLDYLKQRTDVWEWLAYVKLRAIATDLELGKMIETHARHAIHESASKMDQEELKQQTRRVRDRLEKEKAKRSRHAGIDIKYAAGGMLDVYFASRYLQLRDDVPDEGEDRSTRSTLERLEATGSLEQADYQALSNGYTLLRSIDHHLRLIVGRSARLPATDHHTLRDIAKKLGFTSGFALNKSLVERMKSIREAYDRITQGEQT
jgi:glutamate-ammonia-ligase adenylyltransferase